MKTVLIVDDEEECREVLARGLLEYRDEFDVLTAENGQHAIDVWNYTHVDLLITDLKMPVMDGVQLIVHLLRERPSLPVIVMTGYNTPDVSRMVQEFSPFQLIEKPIYLDSLLPLIRKGLGERARGYLKGVTVIGFVQLLQMERRSCTLRVRSHGRTGTFLLEQGEIISASSAGLESERVAHDMLLWEDPEIEVDELPAVRRRIIVTPLQELLLDAVRRHDEGQRPPAAPTEVARETTPRGAEPRRTTPRGSASPASPAPAPPVRLDAPRPRPAGRTLPAAVLRAVLQIRGALAAALVDGETGACVATAGDVRAEVEDAALAADRVRTGLTGLKHFDRRETIEEVVIATRGRLHLLRALPAHPPLLLHLVLDRTVADPSDAAQQLALVLAPAPRV